ncbi:MAG TPA: DEAD/DEAH box helicase [Candidatus Binatia bacterium]|nr:DEAD/DEAH box helicase [Candidatus Binatia bacterium]
MSFDQLGLEAGLLRAVAAQGYTTPTPIQAKAIPVILQGGDLLASAQTGTGKTAAFTLPLLQLLAAQPHAAPGRAPRALVLVPTRELAAQVLESVHAYGAHSGLKAISIFGGVNINPQIDQLRRGVDILVATPGRLLDHVGQRTVRLDQIRILVLDEADRMLDMGFIRDIRRVIGALPRERQNLMFSATFNADIRQLASSLLRNPASVDVAPRNAPAELVKQRIHPVDRLNKPALLSHLIRSGDWTQVLVFTRTKHGANRLAQQLLRDRIECLALHGNKSQNARTRALADFKANRIRVLVATDIAARGLDIDMLPHVVNFDLPNVPEDYVHRIGRTGRAGAEGEAISLVGPDERDELRGIERLLGRSIESSIVPGFERGTVHHVHAPSPEPARQGGHGQRHGHGHARGHAQGRGGRGQGQGRGHGASRGQPSTQAHGHGGGHGSAQGQQRQGQGHGQSQGQSPGGGHGHAQAAPKRRWSGRPSSRTR